MTQEGTRRKGFFFVLEGPDGSGKSTQVRLLKDRLLADGYDVEVARQPGGSSLGEPIRELLLKTREVILSPRAELGLFLADHAQFVQEVVRPALQAGKVLLCDRYINSAIAYQGAGRGLGEDAVRFIAEWMVDGLLPDLTVYLLPSNAALRQRRLERGSTDKLEELGSDFQERVGRSYYGQSVRFLSSRHKQLALPGDMTIEETTNALYRAIKRELESHAS